MPWPWEGSQVVVKDRGGFGEICTPLGDRCICRHPKSLIKGATVHLSGQYNGIPLGGDRRECEAIAQRIAAPEVQGRPLAAYEALLEGMARCPFWSVPSRPWKPAD